MLREYCRKYNISDTVKILTSVPGVGFVTAISIYTEVMYITRFPDIDNMASFVVLIPTIISSAKKSHNLGFKYLHNKYLRNLLIESSCIAIRKDPALLLTYTINIKRISTKLSIIKIAKKLISRIRYVFMNRARVQIIGGNKLTVIKNKDLLN